MQTSAIKSPQKGADFSQFSKSKFTELKAKFPLKTDKQIFGLVNKSWQQTNAKTKNQNSIGSVKNQASLQKQNLDDQVDIRVKQKLVFQQSSSKKQSTKKEQMKEEPERLSERSSVRSTPVKKIKTKAIRKTDRTQNIQEYKKFFKFYNDKLGQEHPRWTGIQRAKIIKLLWRKKVTQQKEAKVTRKRSFRSKGARACFGQIKRSEGHSNQQISKLWKQLTAQNKKYYGIIGSTGNAPRYGFQEKARIAQKTVQKTKVESFLSKPLSFLNKLI